MFDTVSAAPADPIFGLIEAFNQDPRPEKINLGIGIYQDENGLTPVLASVKDAERRILIDEPTKKYLPIDGHVQYARAVQELLFGNDHEVLAARRAVTAHTPGGTGALRVVADLLAQLGSEPTIWLSDPTWVNHQQVFQAAGLKTEKYPYYHAKKHELSFSRLMSKLGKIAPGDVVVLQGCCHNPTGLDPDPDQWSSIADLLSDRDGLALIDFAYQGFVQGMEEDAAAIRLLANKLPEMVICNSFSKNFGLYNERVGAATVVTAAVEQSQAVLSRLKQCIRASYSNPPAHGAAIVAAILGDTELRRRWTGELGEMRERVRRLRRQFAAGLDTRGVKLMPQGNAFIREQKGMFSFSGLNRKQVDALRNNHAIYLLASGRMNVAALREASMDRLCDAIAEVVG